MTLSRLTSGRDYLWGVFLGGSIGVVCLLSPVIAFGTLAGLVFVVTALRYPMLLCYMVVTSTVFLSGMPRGSLIALVIPNEPILLLIAGISFLAIIVRRRSVPYKTSFLLAIIIFVAGTAVIPLLAYYVRDFSLSTGDMFSLVAPVQYLVLVWIFSQIPQNDEERHHVLQWMLFCASIVAAIGLLQMLNVPPVVNLLRSWYPSGHTAEALELGRVTSILGAWNSLGNFLMIAILLVLATYRNRHTRLGYVNTYVALALCGLCLLASGSYASIIGLVIGILLINGVFNRQGGKLLFLLVVGFAAGIFLFQDHIEARLNYQFRDGIVPETLAYRFTVWEQVYFPVIGKHLVWGVSPTFAGFVSWRWAESQYLYLLFRSGLVSLMAHLTFVVLLLRWCYQQIRSIEGFGRSLAAALFSIITALSIMGFTNEVFTSSGAIDYLWILIGLSAGAASRHYLPASLKESK